MDMENNTPQANVTRPDVSVVRLSAGGAFGSGATAGRTNDHVVYEGVRRHGNVAAVCCGEPAIAAARAMLFATAPDLAVLARDFVQYMTDDAYRAVRDRAADEATAGNVTYLETVVTGFQVALERVGVK